MTAAELPGRCPVTGGLTTRMTAPSFREHCAARRAGRTEDWRYKPGTVPPPHPRCEICGGDPQYWPQELTIIDTSQGEPMTTKTTTKTTTKPATKPAAKKTTKPAAAPISAEDLRNAQINADQLRDIKAILAQDGLKPAVAFSDDPVEHVQELVLLLRDANEAIADARCILSAFFGDADGTIVGVATNAVAYAQELERIKGEASDKALSTWAAVGRTVCETILSGRGEIQISIRPSWPVAPETDTEAEP